jgi:hypothetical protein
MAKLSIKSSRDGFRRCGIAWSREETIVDIAEFNDEQIELLKNEPMLTVVEILEEADGEKKGKKSK